jgi:hypothetical protein
MPWKPAFRGERPTLGYYVIDWVSEMLAQPDVSEYVPLDLTVEQVQFVLAWYEIDPKTGRRTYRRGVISRPKGWGKSPLLSALAIVEAMADVVPDGWDADGRPVGKPWHTVTTPIVQVAASSEDQTANAWNPLLQMLQQGPILDHYAIEPMNTFVALPWGSKARIEPVTAAATSREGARPIFCILDQTESWLPSNGGVRLAATMRRNLGKTGGTSIEAPNAYVPGEKSVAEASALASKDIREGRTKSEGVLYDHREAPPTTDMSDRASLLKGLAVAYGDSAILPKGCVIHDPPCTKTGWVNLDRVVAEIWDADTDPQDARRFYLGQITHAADSWLSQPEWAACTDAAKVVGRKELITLGFDGSRGRTTKGKVADSTALMACRVSDGHLWPIGIWEQDPGPAGEGWEPPVAEIEAAIEHAFSEYTVVGFFADDSYWEGRVSAWEGKYAKKLKVKSTAQHPIRWAMNRGIQVVRATERLHTAIVNAEMTHDGSYALTRHALNARRRVSRFGIQIGKSNPDSPNKIDAAVASILAFEARADAVAAGIDRVQPRQTVVKRLW